jgi:hypothetical protein
MMNLPPNPSMGDATPLDANTILREKGPAALRDILDVAPTPIRLVASTKSGLEVVCMADVRPSAIEWLWPSWIAVGKVHVLAGEGGRGKSTILCSITAVTTTGAKWPDGARGCHAGSVIILAAEDYVEDSAEADGGRRRSVSRVRYSIGVR